ncbi:hypothetical protein LTS08_004320 [Lithohypha guttulata]|nr:hypothetical protein LTS08_004320 [Lithohypha guttulata]
MSDTPTLIFIPGSWHKPICYDKIIRILQEEHNIKCLSVTLRSTTGDPSATFKDDIDVARKVITSELTQGRNAVVVAHSYGGMVGNSAVRGLTQPKFRSSNSKSQTRSEPESLSSKPGYVVALILIASGFTITGLAFMDPLFGTPPPSWRVDKETGFAEIVDDPRELFYHDVPDEEAEYWVSQLTTQSLKALFEGGEHAYAGWQDVPTWYVGTIEDKGLPVVLQRVQVGMARGQGGRVYHRELRTSHSPFLSKPKEVVEIVLDAVNTKSETKVLPEQYSNDTADSIANIKSLLQISLIPYNYTIETNETMPADEYSSTPSTGKLKLKGISDGRIDKKKKKKLKPKADTDTTTITTTIADSAKAADKEPFVDRSIVLKHLADEDTSITKDSHPETSLNDGQKLETGAGEKDEDVKRHLQTEAERRFEEQRRKRLEERLKREGVKTHKQRVEELNRYLSSLSEHHDMPKIGPG